MDNTKKLFLYQEKCKKEDWEEEKRYCVEVNVEMYRCVFSVFRFKI